jgi:hypothetical protein
LGLQVRNRPPKPQPLAEGVLAGRLRHGVRSRNGDNT